MLAGHDLAARRGGRVVFAGLGFAAAPGEAVLLTGANGAGKTTVLRVLAGLLRPVEGVVTWEGDDVSDDRPGHARRVRWLGDRDAVKSAMTPAEDLRFWASLHGGDPGAALEGMGLAALADLPCRVLSAGQRRRLALARVTLGDAAVWLLDEPTLGLDAASVARLGAAFSAHRARGGIVVAATHLDLPLPGARALEL